MTTNRTDVPALVAEVKRLQAELDRREHDREIALRTQRYYTDFLASMHNEVSAIPQRRD